MLKNESQVSQFFKETYSPLLQQGQKLEAVLTHLRFEGKPMRGKNLKEACRVVDFFTAALPRQFEFEEQVLYPFLDAHIPKLNPITSILKAEHENFRNTLGRFKYDLWACGENDDPIRLEGTIQKVRESGIYLIYLLHDRMRANQQALYETMERELHSDEKKEIIQRFQKWNALLKEKEMVEKER